MTAPDLHAEPPACPGRPRGFDAERALDAGLQLFWRQGYEATSLEALTQAMGISRSSFYACFGSKHGVLVAALERYSAIALTALAARAEAAEAGPQARIRTLLEAIADPQGGPRGCLLTNCITELAPHDPEIAALGRRHLEAIEALIARTLAPAAPQEAADRARALAALALGTLTLRKAGMPPERITATLAQADALMHP